MRRLWVVGRTLRFLSLRAGRARGGRSGPGGPDGQGGPGRGEGTTGDPLDEADRRRAAIGRSWFVGGEPPDGSGRA